MDHLRPVPFQVSFAASYDPTAIGATAMTVVSGTSHNDYVRSLYDAMPASIKEHRFVDGGPMEPFTIEDAPGDIFHVGWPEHLFGGHEDAGPDDRILDRILENLADSPIRIVWTMHNRRPHAWDPERGRELYRKWARICDGVIHHSAWGMKLVRAELPYPERARHIVISHGHFGALMPRRSNRIDLERKMGLPPSAMRFGVVGRPQKEKQVDLIVEAFLAGAREGQQLFVSAHSESDGKVDDSRVIYRFRPPWIGRDEIADQIHICDALVSAHTGDTYLTSGMSADAIGAGIPMLAPRWEFFLETLGNAPFYHENTVASLARLFRQMTPGAIASAKAAFCALQPKFAWPALAGQTLRFFRGLKEKNEKRALSSE